MFKTESFRALLSPWFLTALALLLLNDFALKTVFANAITGKLSDFAGLFCFPLFVSCFLPRRRGLVYVATAVTFCAWKSPLSQIVIDLSNSFLAIPIGRIVDYTDLLALAVLPISYAIADHKENDYGGPVNRTPVLASLIIVSVFAFSATQFVNERGVTIDRAYRFEMSRGEFERQFRGLEGVNGVEIEKQTDAWPQNEYPNVKTQPNTYYVHFNLNEKYCDANDLGIFSSIRDDGSRIVLEEFSSIHYWCPTAPAQADKEQLTSLFEEKIVLPLGGTLVK